MLTAVLLIAYAPRKWFKNKQFVNLGNIVSQEMKTTERFIIFRHIDGCKLSVKLCLNVNDIF